MIINLIKNTNNCHCVVIAATAKVLRLIFVMLTLTHGTKRHSIGVAVSLNNYA